MDLFQKAMTSPTVKKLRALEQAKSTRTQQRRAGRRGQLVKTLEHLDASAKAWVSEAALDRAADLQQLAEVFAADDSPAAADDDKP